MNKILAFCLVTSITLLTGCNSPFGSNPAQTYTVGGTTSGLAGDGLVLQNNGIIKGSEHLIINTMIS